MTSDDELRDLYSTSEMSNDSLVAAFLELGGGAVGLTGAHDLVSESAILALRPPGPRVTLEEASLANGLPVDLTKSLWSGLGFPADGDLLSESEVEMLGLLAATSEIFGSGRAVELSRVLGLAVRHIAEAIVSTVRIGYELPALTGENVPETARADLAHSYHELIKNSLPVVERVVDVVLRRQISVGAKRNWSPDPQAAVAMQDFVVGFADLVGFTTWSGAASDAELAAALDAFDTSVWRVASETGIELIKMIGDEVMFTAETVEQAIEASRRLSEAAPDLDDAGIRVGVASGRVLSRSGDLFGPTVNLAARLVAAAEPSSLLIHSDEIDETAEHETEDLRLAGFQDTICARVVRF